MPLCARIQSQITRFSVARLSSASKQSHTNSDVIVVPFRAIIAALLSKQIWMFFLLSCSCVLYAHEYGHELRLKDCGVGSHWNCETHSSPPAVDTGSCFLLVLGAICAPVISVVRQVCLAVSPFLFRR